MRNINSILKKNRRILADLAAAGKREIRSVTLARLGFDFEHFTSTRKKRDGSMEHYCYDLSYVPVTNRVYLLKTRPHE